MANLAVSFDGATRLFRTGGDLTGNADGTKGSIAIWIRTPATGWPPAVFQTLLSNTSGYVLLRLLDTGALQLSFRELGTGTTHVTLRTSVLSAGTSYAILASWDTAGGTAASRLYVNDVSNLAVNTVSTAGTIDYTLNEWSVGAGPAATAANHWIGSIADLWVNFTTNIDFSVEAKRRLFYTAENCIVPKGSTGVVDGVTPILFFSDPLVADWHKNKGTGGDVFVVQGTLTQASVQPCWASTGTTERLAPDALLASSNLRDSLSNSPPTQLSDIQDDPDSPDANWWTSVSNSVATDLRVSFPTPSAALTGVQTFQVLLRKTTGPANPTVDIELWEQGVGFIATLANDIAITSTTGQLVVANWDPTTNPVGNAANVELRVVSTPASG